MKATRLTDADRERGAILILGAVGMVLAMISAALSVDLGRLAQERRNNQKVADLAALDAVRALHLGDPLEAARRSAERNGFPWSAPSYGLSTQPGTTDGDGNFVPGPLATATALQVEVTSPFRNQFAPGERVVKARAVSALAGPMGSVAVGSTLAGASATVGATEVKVLNRLLSRIISPGTVNVDAVGWKGIADAAVSFERLRAALGLTAGSVDGALDASLTYRQLLDATVDALEADGSPTSAAAVTPLGDIATEVEASLGASVRLRDLFDITGTVGNGADVADARLRVLDVVR